MVLKFHMQHDKAAGRQNDKIQACRELKKAADTKKKQSLKSTFSSDPLDIFD